MRMRRRMLYSIARGACAAMFVLGTANLAHADGFISPFIGYNFGGDSGCQEVSNCETKTRNIGVAIGSLGAVVGGEFEFNFIDQFFGQRTDVSSNLFTMMGNVMFAPKVGPIQPYVLTGLGVMKTHVEFTPTSLVSTNNNNLAWDIGGGVIGFFTPHFGIRGDLRYFHSFQDLSVLNLNISDTKIDYGRVAGAVVLKF
jgi:outer membrane protein with beta-barrel domain